INPAENDCGYGVDRLWRSLGQYRRLRFIIGQKRYFVHVTFILQDFLSSPGNVSQGSAIAAI
ncbi:hypothetical protein, partial [Microcoleus sp. herbarium2]|uniref:hypothetical protein n=1 Tax=Microcoleus sp. herbarium2 TaxID=3055433 RepID=UPI002FD4E7DD